MPTGDPLNPKTIIGPIIRSDALKMIDGRVKEAIATGAKAHTGAKHDGQISGSSPPSAQNLKRAAAGAYEEGRSRERSAAPRVRCRHEEQLSRQILCSEGIGFGQSLSSQHEGDRIVVRCSYLVMYPARTGPYRSANKCPINTASGFEQATRGSCQCARGL